MSLIFVGWGQSLMALSLTRSIHNSPSEIINPRYLDIPSFKTLGLFKVTIILPLLCSLFVSLFFYWWSIIEWLMAIIWLRTIEGPFFVNAIILLTLIRPFFCSEFYLEVQTLFCACPLPLTDCSLSIDHLHAAYAMLPSPHQPHPPPPSPLALTPCPLTYCTSNYADDMQMAWQVRSASTAVIPTSHICTQHQIFFSFITIWSVACLALLKASNICLLSFPLFLGVSNSQLTNNKLRQQATVSSSYFCGSYVPHSLAVPHICRLYHILSTSQVSL